MTKSTLLHREHIDYAEEPLFFGKGRNIVRLDLTGDEFIKKQTDRQLGLMWFPSDFSYTQDAIDFSTLSDDLQDLYLANLKLQQLYDSVVARSVPEVFSPVTTNPQLEQWWTIHAFFEQIHLN